VERGVGERWERGGREGGERGGGERGEREGGERGGREGWERGGRDRGTRTECLFDLLRSTSASTYERTQTLRGPPSSPRAELAAAAAATAVVAELLVEAEREGMGGGLAKCPTKMWLSGMRRGRERGEGER